MIGNKMVLTYKRKRFSSRPGLGFENECQTLQVMKTPLTEEEEDSKDESERKDYEDTDKSSSEMVKTNVDENQNIVSDLCSGRECNLVSVSGQIKNEPSLEAVKSNNLCEETVKENKAGLPLITFSRRFRHKKAVDVSVVQDQNKSTVVEKNDLVVMNGSNSTMNNNLSTDFTNDLNCTASQEKKTSEDVGVHSLHVPKTEISERPTSESHIVLSDGIRINKKRDGGSVASFDLSKPPPELSGLVDCNLTLESSSNTQPENNPSETHRDSTDSTSRSHSTVLHEFPSQRKVLELLDERIGETSLSQLHCGPTGLSSSSNHTWVPDLPGQSHTSKHNFLQLFPEDKANDLFPLKNPLQEKPFMHHKDKQPNRKNLHFRTSNPFGLSPWPAIDTPGTHYPSDSVSLMRHKLMLDNIISKARTISNKKDNFDPGFDRPKLWSEDELDFLWIGVRRHGIGNWDLMLRDPRLHFSRRSGRELAEKWEEEHSKLLITKTPPQNKRFRPCKKYEEPQLSLGVKGNLPHWLWEAVSVPPSVGMMQWINQPFSGPELRASGGPHQCNSVGKVDEVIVINSDASSEETISDDHSVRV